MNPEKKQQQQQQQRLALLRGRDAQLQRRRPDPKY